ncbi:MAG: hypothetical protein V4498_04960 [candidate division FCPU426 bacterium]
MRPRLVFLSVALLLCSGAAAGPISTTRATVNGKACTVVTWSDSHGKPRTLSMIDDRPAATSMTYYIGNELVTDNELNHAIGEMVNHGSCGATVSSNGSSEVVSSQPLKGSDHLIFRYTFKQKMCSEPGKQWRVCEDWVFRSGQDSFLQAVAFDSSDVPAGEFLGDDLRGPYCQTDWPRAKGVSRVAWGNSHKFQTTSAFIPVPASCLYSCSGKASWIWEEPNTIPYVWEWCDPKLGASVDREWGIVQNLPDSVMDFGGAYYATGNMPAALPARSVGDAMPECWAAPTQMSCYDSAWNSGRITWGAVGNNGNVGADRSVFNNGHHNDRRSRVMGDIFRPVAGFSWMHLIDAHSADGVRRLVRDTENIFASTLSATVGTVNAAGPRGPGNHVGPGVGGQIVAGVMPSMTYPNPGFDHVYRTWNATASHGKLALTLKVSGSLVKPSFVVFDFPASSPCSVQVAGKLQVAGKDYFADYDAAGKKLWLTLTKDLGPGVQKILISGDCAGH